ncbi:MAG: type II/IV secretion system protein [Nitrospirae bacterium]|nr:type II/IV secretion system protein [Nitrospirota bacterium]
MKEKKKLGELLIEKKIITTAQLEEALKKQKELGLPLGETLIKLKFVSENFLLETLARHLEIEFLNIAEDDYKILDKSLVKILPMEICQKLRVLPLFQIIDDEMKELTLAMADPLADHAVKEVEELTGCTVSPILTTSAAIEGGINKLFDVKVSVVKAKTIEEDSDIVRLVNKILLDAVNLRASDIHIEPHAKEVHIRMRIDGVLQLVMAIPSSQHPGIVSRLKIMGSEQKSVMKIEEKRLPQDGSLSRVIGGHAVDCRLSTLPAIYGEKIVLRLFDKDRSTHVGRIAGLKMSPRMELEFRRSVRQPNGIVVVTGPTGSGKTTTLHAVINEINDVGINIITVEDPVEYNAPDYINQSSLIPPAGYTFGRALRAIMRQDPDVILIGEIRDRETAEIAVQAALTGHRVYTTLHTEDAAGAVMRMIDIGVEHFLVSSTLVSALNQRLLRKICPYCAEEYVPTRVEMMDIDIDKHVIDEILNNPEKHKLRRGVGCSTCRQTGYRERQGVFEMLTVTPDVRNMILQKQNADVIAEKTRESQSMNMIFEEGLRLVLSGVTTLGEMQRLPRGDYKMKSVEKIFQDAQVV